MSRTCPSPTPDRCRRLSERRLGLTLPVAIAVAGLLLLAPLAAAQVNRIVLRVDDEIATLYDYQQRLAQRLGQIQRSEIPPERQRELLDTAGEDVMQELLEEMLAVSRAEQLGIEPTRSEIEAAVNQARESFDISSEEQFREALAQSGMRYEEFREQMKRNIMIQTIMAREVQPRIEIADEDLRRSYRENIDVFQVPARVELREVVALESSGLGAPDLARVATQIRDKVLAGEELEEVIAASAASELTTGVINLGWVSMDDLDDALAAAVEEVEVGAWSEPVAARGGMHLVQVLAREEARTLEFEEVADRIEQRERSLRFQDEMQEYLAELAEKAYILADPPPEAAGFLVGSSGGFERDDPFQTFELPGSLPTQQVDDGEDGR